MYPILDVPVTPESLEQLGTKYKVWYRDPAYGRSMFKEGRPGTLENVAEKIAAELAALIGLPHALYDLATYQERQGVITRSLVDRGARLVHGNELLASSVDSYVRREVADWRNSDHTLSRVIAYFKKTRELVGAPYGFKQTDAIKSALDVFAGYLMFDAWIGNQDRHDLNWGVLRAIDGNSFLAPSYDHGSSMGRNESDETRYALIHGRDRGRSIEAYVERARSAFYPTVMNGQKARSITTMDAFLIAARHSVDAAKEWQGRLANVGQADIVHVLNQVPTFLMSDVAKEFTLRFLMANRARILAVQP